MRVNAETYTELINQTLPLGVLLLFAFHGCGPSSENDPQIASVSVRDSAGVVVVEAPREVIEALPEWSLELDLDLGGVDADAEHEFFRVNGARILADGTLAVVNSGSQEIFFYDQQWIFRASACNSARTSRVPGNRSIASNSSRAVMIAPKRRPL